MQQPEDHILPVYTSVVRLKSYGKGDDTHICRSRRPHLFVLLVDALEVFTTADAGSMYDESMNSLVSMPYNTDTSVSLIHRKQGPFANLPRPNLFRKKQNNTQRATTATATIREEDSSTHRPQEYPEELVEGQVFRLGVALNQVISVHVLPTNQNVLRYSTNRIDLVRRVL